MKNKILAVATALLIAVALAAISNTEAATFTATPANSNIIRLTGTGFNHSEPVHIEMFDGATSIYNFTETITTDGAEGDLGNFTAVVIVPTSIAGTYNITASTSTVTATLENYNVPNLVGPQGPQGVQGLTGANGTKGDTGATGPQGDVTNVDQTGAYAVGVVAFLVALLALVAALIKRK